MIYLNNAATTLDKPEGVKEARRGLSGVTATTEEIKERMAKLLKVKNAENILLTHSGTEALELALRAYIGEGEHVIATVNEMDSTWAVLEQMGQELGVTLSTVGVNPYGLLNYDEIEGLVRPETTTIVCAHGSAVTGNLVDLDKVCTIARRHKLRVISDGCQAVGATDMNLEAVGVDVYCFTGHKKLMGPHCIGGICLKDGKLEEFLAGADAAPQLKEKLDTLAPETLGAMAIALDFIKEKGIYGIAMCPHRLAKRFFESVSSMDAVRIYGDFGTGNRIPTVALSVEGFTPEQVKEHMAKKYGIAVNVGLQDCKKLHEALGTAETGLTRFSFGYFNTRRDVNDTIWAMMDLLGLKDLYYLA